MLQTLYQIGRTQKEDVSSLLTPIPDVLVNNAGYGLVGSVEDMSVEELKAQYETNVIGTFRVTKAVLPHMRKRARRFNH